MLETETFGPCLVQKLRWKGRGGGHGPTFPPGATLLQADKNKNIEYFEHILGR